MCGRRKAGTESCRVMERKYFWRLGGGGKMGLQGQLIPVHGVM